MKSSSLKSQTKLESAKESISKEEGAMATDLTCPVCLEPFRVANNPAQLPCAHFMCIQCIKKLYPVEKKGLKCPVCQRNHATYMVCEHAGAPGGVMIAEVHR